MADQTIIPPVSNSTSLSKRRTPARKDRAELPAKKQPKDKQRKKKDDGKPHFDNYA